MGPRVFLLFDRAPGCLSSRLQGHVTMGHAESQKSHSTLVTPRPSGDILQEILRVQGGVFHEPATPRSHTTSQHDFHELPTLYKCFCGVYLRWAPTQ